MRKILLVVAVIAAALLAWRWFGHGGDGAIGRDDPLAFVPADTPYVFGNIEPLPGDLMARYLAQMDPQIAQWRRQIGQVLTQLDTVQADTATPEGDDVDADDAAETAADGEAFTRRATAWLRAIDAELAAAPTAPALMARIGFDPAQARTAVYGIGLVPVSRTTLADSAAFVALIERLQQAAGESLVPLQLDGVERGWRFIVPEVPIQGVVAIIDGQLVLTIAPPDDAAALRTLLGLERPAHALADSGALQALNRAEGFTAYGSGYLDVARLLAQFQAPATALESAFLKAFETEKPNFPAGCEADVARLVKAVPRLIVGYTRMDAREMDVLARIETSAEIAAELRELRAPMPGLRLDDDALAVFGSALKISALPALANKLGAATRATPWTCPALLGLNEATATTRESLNNPAVYAAGPMANSLLLSLDRIAIDVPGKRLADIAGRFVIGSDNPAGLIATARNFVPQLASLKLEAGAPAQTLALDTLAEFTDQPAFVALGKTALGVAIGKGEDARLPEFLETRGEARPVLYVRYRGALMAEIARAMKEVAADLPEAERTEVIDSARMLEDVYARQMEAVEMAVELAPAGIELRQKIVMKP